MSDELVWQAYRLTEPDDGVACTLTVEECERLLYEGLGFEAARLVLHAYAKGFLAESFGGKGALLVARRNAGRHMLVSDGRLEVEYVIVATPDHDDVVAFLTTVLRLDEGSVPTEDPDVPPEDVPDAPVAIGGRRRLFSGFRS